MISEFLGRAGVPSYAQLHDSKNFFIHLIYPFEGDGADVYITLKDLLSKNHRDGVMFVFHAPGYGIFLLWATRSRTLVTTTNTGDETSVIFQDFMENTRSKQRQICALYNPKSDRHKKMLAPDQESPVLAVLARYDQELLNSLGMSPDQREELAQLCRVQTNSKMRRTLLYSARVIVPCIFGFIACLLLFYIMLAPYRKVASDQHDKYHSWMAYNTRGSIGPKFQLSITGHNASEWESYVHDGNQQWALRIDDQALIPLELMDEEERHYQEWFQNRYPEISQISINHDYINETWLNSPAVDLVPVDDLFHFSHCILALKRYWKAKKTGQHVCGRDIDEEHIGHCIDSFDWWAFPEGRRGTSRPNIDLPLWWRTKVCFD